MATKTAARRKPTRKAPVKRQVTIQLGGGSGAVKRPAKRKPKVGRRVAKYVGTRTWRGVSWLAVKGAKAGTSTTVSLARSTSGSVAQWGQDKARFGLGTPLVRVTALDADDHATTQRIPRGQIRERTAVLLGDASEPSFRFTGDRVRADEPDARVWAESTRLDREVVPMAARRKESKMAQELSRVGELFGYEPDEPEDIPEALQEAIDEIPAMAEGFSELGEKMRSWNVDDPVPGKFDDIAERLSEIETFMKEAKAGIEEQLEHQIRTTKQAQAS